MTKKEITENIKTLSGIDALYYQLNISYDHYIQFYHKELLVGNLDNYECLERLSRSFDNQYVIYDYHSKDGIKIATIMFKNLNTNDGLESITIQHDTTYMNQEGYLKSYHDVCEFIEYLGLPVNLSKIQRIDLNSYVFGIDFSFLSMEYFSTLSKNNSIVSETTLKGTEKQTFTLGSRNGRSVYMRIYDKRAELKVKDKDGKKERMIQYRYLMKFGLEIDVMQDRFYNVEFELKRECLKSYGINTVEQALEKRYHIINDIMTKRIRLLNKKKPKKNKQRIPTHLIWEIIRTEYLPDNENYDITKVKQKVYIHDTNWLLSKVDEYLECIHDKEELISAKIKILNRFNLGVNND